MKSPPSFIISKFHRYLKFRNKKRLGKLIKNQCLGVLQKQA